MLEEEESEASYLRKLSRKDSPGMDSRDTVVFYNAEGEDMPTTTLDTLTSKIKFFCPSLFFSLFAWEWDAMDSFASLGKGNSRGTPTEPSLEHVGTCPIGSVTTPLEHVAAQFTSLPLLEKSPDYREHSLELGGVTFEILSFSSSK